jgi:ubiquinone biosynthesis monooxygenase Coq7
MDEPSFARTVSRILRVNHAGEVGAIRIYAAQIFVARLLRPGVLPFLTETIAHERRHAAVFKALMAPRGTRSCYALPLWGIGGTALGLFTGLIGRNAIMICTEAVERVVHAHLNAQLAYIGGRDPDLSEAIRAVRDEEVGHYDGARNARTSFGLAARMLDGFVAGTTWLLIWCSTYGALTRMDLTSPP